MPRKTLFWSLYPPFVLLALAGLLATALFTVHLFRQEARTQQRAALERHTRLVAELVRQPLAQQQTASLQALVERLGQQLGLRITVLTAEGFPAADSAKGSGASRPGPDHPEFEQSTKNRREAGKSPAGGINDLSLTLPVRSEEQLLGFIRLAPPSARLCPPTRDLLLTGALAGGVLLAAVALVSLLLARRLGRPLRTMQQALEEAGAGRSPRWGAVGGPREMEGLARSMQHQIRELLARIKALQGRLNEQKAVLSSMWGAVVAVDRQERVLNFNQSAARLFGVDPAAAKGRPLAEVLRHLDLQDFLHQSLLSDRPLEGEIVLRAGAEELFLQAHGTRLHDAAGEIMGALVVLNDMTKLRRLERIRRDFVANVSHELRTPVTSIRGFVETLLDGAIDEPDQAREFLAIIARQSERLNAIIEDLLSLSRLERETEKKSLVFEKCRVASLLAAAVQTCEVEAAAKTIPITMQCPADLTARLNGPLIEQAVVNLVANAVKYSDSAAPVEVSARQDGPYLYIQVRDQGRGIARRHLDRLFERFYRVDKGRNRGGGGTGLGLAIVKHIMLAHHGRVVVESQPGRGSTFTLQIPLNNETAGT